jgi:hypothetical protein
MTEMTHPANINAVTTARPEAQPEARHYYYEEPTHKAHKSPSIFNAIMMLAGLNVLGGGLALLARGIAGRWEFSTGSSARLTTLLFLILAELVVVFFLLVIRWARS